VRDSACVGVNWVRRLLTQEPIEVILRGIVPIRRQTGRARALTGEARVHLPAHVGVVVAIVIAGQVRGVGKAAAAGRRAGRIACNFYRLGTEGEEAEGCEGQDGLHLGA
jgi:hypothetical protein